MKTVELSVRPLPQLASRVPMINDVQEMILSLAVVHWNESFCGISGLDLAEKLSEPHETVLEELERLAEGGAGRLNRDVTLHRIKIPVEEGQWGAVPESEALVTHIFFPAPSILEQHFFDSDLSKAGIPEYKARLHRGGSQLALVYFDSEVLYKYSSSPELFEIYDTRAGGSITTLDAARDSDYVGVKFGKRVLENGRTSIALPLKDLAEMAEEQQRYWHAYEISSPGFKDIDPDFGTYIGWTYKGEWQNSVNLLEELKMSLKAVNEASASDAFFKRDENPHLRRPTLNSYKALCDSCSELYKLVGPDNLSRKSLRSFLLEKVGCSESDLTHSSGRELSDLRMLCLIERRLAQSQRLCSAIEEIRKHRIDADHRILAPARENRDVSKEFSMLTTELVEALRCFAVSLCGL